MTSRENEIQSFYWMIMSLLGTVFGYLMVLGGGLFALSFLLEKVRTGVVTFGGATHADRLTAMGLIVGPALIAIAGWALARSISRRRTPTPPGAD